MVLKGLLSIEEEEEEEEEIKRTLHAPNINSNARVYDVRQKSPRKSEKASTYVRRVQCSVRRVLGLGREKFFGLGAKTNFEGVVTAPETGPRENNLRPLVRVAPCGRKFRMYLHVSVTDP